MGAVMMGRRDLRRWAKEEFAHAVFDKYQSIAEDGLSGIEYDEREALRRERDSILRRLGFHVTIKGLEERASIRRRGSDR